MLETSEWERTGTSFCPPALRYYNILSYHNKKLKTVLTHSQKKKVLLAKTCAPFFLTVQHCLMTLVFWSILVNQRQVQRYVYMCLFWWEYLYRYISEYFLLGLKGCDCFRYTWISSEGKGGAFKHGTRLSLLSHQNLFRNQM